MGMPAFRLPSEVGPQSSKPHVFSYYKFHATPGNSGTITSSVRVSSPAHNRLTFENIGFNVT